MVAMALMRGVMVLLVCAAATRPARPVKVDALASETNAAVAAAENNALLAYQGRVTPLVASALNDLKKPDLPTITRLATLREYGRYFGRLKEPTEQQRQTLGWLIQQQKLSAALLLSVSDFDPPDGVLEVLRGLREAHRSALEENAALAAALCLVWDAPERHGGTVMEDQGKADSRPPARLFAYFSKAPLRWEARALPVELLVYMVDVDVSEDDLAWAQMRYRSTASPAVAYTDVPYDERPAYGERKSEDVYAR